MFLLQKQVTETERTFNHRKKVYVTETNFCRTTISVRERNSFRKQVFMTETSFCPSFRQRNTFLSQTNCFCHRKNICHRKKHLSQKNILPQTKFSVREINFHHRSTFIGTLYIKT